MAFDLLDFFDAPLNEQQEKQLRDMGFGQAIDLRARVRKIKVPVQGEPGNQGMQNIQKPTNQGGLCSV